MNDAIDERVKVDHNENEKEIALNSIKHNPYLPSNAFDQERLEDLAESIKLHVILQSIVLRKTISGYNIVVGERRFRASKLAGSTTIPAIVKVLSDEDMMEL